MGEKSELEEKLRSRIKKIKLITLLTAVLFAVLCIVFFIIREAGKEVTVIESPIPVIPDYISVSYSTAYSALAGICLVASVIAFSYLFMECILAKVYTVEACGSTIVFYKAFSSVLYVDGKKAERSYHYWEAPLANGETVTVSVSRNTFYIHMSFSGGHPPIDL